MTLLLIIGPGEWLTAVGTTITATALIAIVALLWRMRDQVSAVDSKMALIEQKLETNNKESNLRFMMVDQKFVHVQGELERQAIMLEKQRAWQKEE